ncbi:phosphatidylcholine-hydrolyzing phospholipase [Fusarium longipes]|uniref:Phosphatidylcholine-hydrolyzing phospholipase n=1 Tax=Fusarium longipes TaxID=694270 RepID=A0A395T2A9_9HYPO|nr:phosphatidylcholine-hydrolyzing phospholipase [Fusarium longipes]
MAPDGIRFHKCANFWGLVIVSIHDREGNVEDKNTFTLRNCIVNFNSYEEKEGTNLAILTSDTNGPVKIDLIAKDGILKSSHVATGAKGVYSFVKTLKNGNSDEVLLTTFDNAGSDTIKMTLDVVNVTGGAPAITKHQTTISVSPQSSQIILTNFHLDTSNAILEVSSFYGVLGIRLFAPVSDKNLADYKEVGMLQYMGQTNIGTGLGCAGDWGDGILTWGAEVNDFVDFESFTLDADGNTAKGNWGMSASDTSRPLVKGCDVESRPGYKA